MILSSRNPNIFQKLFLLKNRSMQPKA